MTEDELKAIEARANAATQGPWRQGDTVPGAVFASGCRRHLVACGPSSVGTIADAAFIAAARQDVSALAAEVRALRERAEWAEECVRSHDHDENVEDSHLEMEAIRFKEMANDNCIAALKAVQRAEAAEAECARLRAALENYGMHLNHACPPHGDCTCGLDAALAAKESP